MPLPEFFGLLKFVPSAYRALKTGAEKWRFRKDDKQIKTIYNGLITLWRNGHVPTISAEFGTDMRRILEKMVERKLLERFGAMPGNYILPGTVRLPR